MDQLRRPTTLGVDSGHHMDRHVSCGKMAPVEEKMGVLAAGATRIETVDSVPFGWITRNRCHRTVTRQDGMD